MQKQLFDYLRNNLFSLLTVIIGCIALIATQLIKSLPADTIAAATLTLVIFLATSQLVDNARKLDKIEKSIQDGFQEAIASLAGVSVVRMEEPEKGLLYVADKFKNAKNRIDHIALSPPLPRNNVAATELEKVIEKTLLVSIVRYRYVCNFYDPVRIVRVTKHLSNPKISKFFVGHFPTQEHPFPLPNFILVDDDEVILYFPFVYGEPEAWISIKHPDVIKVFARYFQRVWNDCGKLTAKDIADGVLERIVSSKT